MSIREEFERAFESELGLEFDAKYSVGRPSTIALWAAKFMAEKCAAMMKHHLNAELLLHTGEMTPQEIRTVKAVLQWKASQLRSLAQELSR